MYIFYQPSSDASMVLFSYSASDSVLSVTFLMCRPSSYCSVVLFESVLFLSAIFVSLAHIMCFDIMLHDVVSYIMLLLAISSIVLLLKQIMDTSNVVVLVLNVIRIVSSSGSRFSSMSSSMPAISYILYSLGTLLTTSLLYLVVLSILLCGFVNYV